MRRALPLIAFCGCLATSCSRSNMLILGRVRAQAGSHPIVVTDCYRTSVPAVEHVGTDSFRWAPCRDAVIVIRGTDLVVNNEPARKLKPGDSILVDHGKVKINEI